MRSVKAVLVLLALLFVAAAAATALSAVEGQPTPQTVSPNQASRPNSRWWQDESFRKELGLTAEQSTRLDQIVQAHLVKFREAKDEHDRLEAQLSALIADPKTTEQQVSQQVDLVEASRSRMGKTRTMMLFKMRCVLTPDQRVKLDQYYAKLGRDHSSHSRNHQ